MLVIGLTLFTFAAEVTLLGECPGEVTFDITEITPGANVGILVGDGTGSAPVPAGPCAGTSSGLDVVATFIGPVRDLDPDGRLWMRPRLPEIACDRRFVVLDLSTCETSDPVDFGVGGADPACGHRVEAFVEDGTMGQYCGGDAPAHYRDYGEMPFDDCECLANRTGTTWAVGSSSPVEVVGWLGDDDGLINATTSASDWTTESIVARDSSQRCVLAWFEDRTSPSEFPPEEMYVDADGRIWHYWNFTAQTSSQVHAFADDVGGRIINPRSVGLGALGATTGLTHWCHAAARFNDGDGCNSDNICNHVVGYFE
jgi:hypothetical protein